MDLYNYISLIVFTVLALLTVFIKSKKAFITTNFIVVGLLVTNYAIILYLAYTYNLDNIKGLEFETLFYNVEWYYNMLIYNFIGVLIFLVLNSLLLYYKLWMVKSTPN
jgi:hypothetical protein